MNHDHVGCVVTQRLLPTRSVLRIFRISVSLPRLDAKASRAASVPRINFQCFQTLEEEGHNERTIALGRKAWLFCGSDRGGQRAAIMYGLITTAKLNDVDPQAWLADVLARINDMPQTRLRELLPWEWKAIRNQTKAD